MKLYFPMPDKPTTLPHTLKKRRLKIRPTRYGVVFIILLLGMFAGSVNYNNNLGFLLTFLLGSIAGVSIPHTYKNVSGIRIVACNARPVFVGQQASFEFVTDDSGLGRNGIKFSLSNGLPATLNFINESANRIDVQTTAVSRGVLRPWPVLIYSDFPLGLFRVQSQLHLDYECIVYPKPKIDGVKTSVEKAATETADGLNGPGTDEFQGLNSYIPGDPFQRISWKASSRGRGLFTKDFNGHYGASLYLDWHLLESRNTEHRLSLLCHAVLKSQQRNLVYGLKLPGTTIEPGNGQIHQNRCLKALALFSN